MDQMCLFTEAVARGRQNALVVADMPFMSYQSSKSQAIENAGRSNQVRGRCSKDLRVELRSKIPYMQLSRLEFL